MFRDFFRGSACILLFLLSWPALAEDTRFTTAHFSGSGNCATCHDGLTDTSGENVSIVRDWGSSMMANATKDPFWQAKVATELDRNSHLSAVINDTCSKCHAPMANYEITRVQGGELTLFGPDGVLNPNHALYDAAMNGVSCTLCHQITDDGNLGTLNGFSGGYSINDTGTIYGQYNDIFGQPMINNTGYTPTFAAHVSDSALCATCHNVKTPFVDAQGNVLTTGPESAFPEQMPYTEWQHSIFDDAGSNPTSCQDCHMPKTTSKVSNRPRWLGTKNGFAKHHLTGANTVMLTLLRDNAAALDVDASSLDLGITRARDMLQSAATVEIVSAAVDNGLLEARVRVENKSGHKAPTSYPSRRMWLNFKVTDSNNNVVFESGKFDNGLIAGANGDDVAQNPDQPVVEPHHNLITASDQVQIYEAVMGDSAGKLTYTLLRGAQYLKDNRLTPKGFDKNSVPQDVAVVGAAMNNDLDFNLGSDEVVYRIQLASAGDHTVSVALNYQTISHGFLQDLYAADHLEQVQTFRAMYDAQNLKHEQVASAQATVISDGGGTPPPPAAAPAVTLSAEPPTVDPGQSTTLSWNSTDTDSCTAAWTDSNAAIGSDTVNPAVTTTYTMSCSGAGGGASDSVTVTVNEPPAVSQPTVNLAASPSSIARGGSITLSWSSTDVNSCTASGSWSGSKAIAGTQTIQLYGPATFALSCSGDGGSVSDTVSYWARGRRWLELR